ncbi:MAG: nucleotidyl transferase AbiEii/AbiGii toxin family protein [Polyangiaceae bacterium]|nr:nucleotidyl transferase AbiEii/AbiGii toxin family protein [Polyangiaceae bacterium]
MKSETTEAALAHAAATLQGLGVRFALVGGLAISVRSEVRFTRDVDLAVAVANDVEAEDVIYRLRAAGYSPVTTVEHERHQRLATARLRSPSGLVVDLIFASCGIEAEVVNAASMFDYPGVGAIPVAESEELLAMKVLSMTDQRLQDRIDARNLLLCNEVDLARVRQRLREIEQRGYDRDQDLSEKLETVLTSLAP